MCSSPPSCNSVIKLASHQDAGRNGPCNGTEEDKRRGEFLLLLSGELGFSGWGGGGRGHSESGFETGDWCEGDVKEGE